MDPVNPKIIAVPDLEIPMIFDSPKEMAMREGTHDRIQAEIYHEDRENGGRMTTSVRRTENILLLHLGGCRILRDSIPRIGKTSNKKRMNGRYQKNSRRSLRWCFATES